MRVWAVADSDSYLKWSAATLAALPAAVETRLVLLASPVLPSPAQIRAAVGHPVEPWSLARLLAALGRDRPDVLLLGCTGPVVAALTSLAPVRRRGMLLVSGLPGQSLPASRRAVASRAACDLLIVHSRRERTAFRALVADVAPGLRVGLARLPFLAGPAAPVGAEAGTDLVFAAQALVPADPEKRKDILRALASVDPPGSAVVKVRAVAGEQQTHREDHPYPQLWADLVAAGEVPAGAVRFAAGPMSDALHRARALVTVSSTAALEAISLGLPVAVLRDFGVNDALLNAVFDGSGCLATLADVRAGRIARADPDWCAANGLHPPAESDWTDLLIAPAPGRRRRPRLRRRELARALARLLVPGVVLRRRRRLSDPDPR